MASTGILQSKSEAFSIRIIKLRKFLVSNFKENTLSNQIYRSGTSISANISEAFAAESDADFVHKLQISLKEANETRHWIRLLYGGEFITELGYNSMLEDCEELIKLLVYTIKKKKNKNSI